MLTKISSIFSTKRTHWNRCKVTQSDDQVLKQKEDEFRDRRGRPHSPALLLWNHDSDWEVSRTWLDKKKLLRW